MGPSHVNSNSAAAPSLITLQWCIDTSNHAGDAARSGRSTAGTASVDTHGPTSSECRERALLCAVVAKTGTCPVSLTCSSG